MSDHTVYSSSSSSSTDMSAVYEHSCKVALNFVKQYYTMLHTDSSQLHRFYISQSAYIHGSNEVGKCSPALGQKEIQEKVDSLGFSDVHASIKQVDALPSGGNGILIQVTGELSTRGSPMRAFVQSFVLSQDGPKKYSIVADIFRYQEDGELFDEPPENTYPADEQIEVQSPQNGDLPSQEVSLPTQPITEQDDNKPDIPSVPAGSQPMNLPDTELINDWSMDADEICETQNGPVEYPDGTGEISGVVVEQTAVNPDEDIEPDQHEPLTVPDHQVRDPSEGQRNMSYASISSKHVPPGVNKVSEPRFTTARNYVTKKKPAFQAPSAVAGRDTRSGGPPMGQYRPKASSEMDNRGPREQFQIFVGGLPKECRSEDLLECFRPYGIVTDVKIHPNGYGFVGFSSEDQVNQVIDKKTFNIQGSSIRAEKKGSSGSKPSNSRSVPPVRKRDGQRSEYMSDTDRDQLIQRGCSLLSEYIRSDDTNPDLATHLRVTSHDTCTLSGMEQHDYPPLESADFSLAGLSHISSLRKQSFPQELLQQLDQTQFNCMTGVFPEINRIWITVDHRVYLWNYSDTSDLAYYDGLQEVILSVSLYLPIPGVLRSHIQYLLFLTTPSNIVALGVSFDGSDHGVELLLHPEPLFCLTTDGVSLTVVPNGSLHPCRRVFFGGKDGCLYEFLYKAKEDWFGGRCKKVNHSSSFVSYLLPSFLSFGEEDPIKEISLDTSRHHLYTLSVSGTISVYDMGAEGNIMSRVTSLTLDSITQICCGAALTSDKGLFRPIVSIHTLSKTSSTNLHLIAVTKSGVRLYFTTTPNGILARPSLLALVHVRLPPGFSAASSSTRPPRSVSGSYLPLISSSVFLMSVNTGESTDSVWIMSQDLFPFQSTMMETRHVIRLPCSVWGISESETVPITGTNPDIVPVCSSQHLSPNREIIILTANEIYKLYVLRPMEQLRDLLAKFSPDSEEISAFFKLLRQGQASAMCLQLASESEQRIAAGAAQAFFRYGGEPKILSPSVPSEDRSNPRGYLGKAMIGPDILYSDKLHGLGLYLSRILRPLWKTPLVQQTHGDLYEPLFQEITLELMRARLLHLRDFLDTNPSLRNAPSPLEPLSTNTSLNSSIFKSSLQSHNDTTDPSNHKQYIESIRYECNQIEGIYHITDLSIELLSLLMLLLQHQLPLIIQSLSKDQQHDLTIMTYCDLLLVHRQVISALLSALLARYHGNERMTEELSDRLLQLTPNLYSADDAKRAKAEECVSMASQLSGDTNSKTQKDALLEESLQLFMQVSHLVSLSAVCDKYYEMHFNDGIVDLCLSAAHRLDPDNRAKSYVDNGKIRTDAKGLSALEKRDSCYQTIVDYLERSHKPGRGDTDTLAHESILTRALSAPEELLHHAMYSHLIESHQEDRLVQINTAYLEVYLRASADSAPSGDISYLGLLWRYYKNADNFMAAAKVLHCMSTSSNKELQLSNRIELLSRAVMCAGSHPIGFNPAAGLQEFIQETRDKLEVAQIQLGIQTALIELNTSEAIEAASQLHLSLLDNTKLYMEFATPFGLSEWRLSILHSSGHQDLRLVEDLWTDMISTMFKQQRTDGDVIGLLRKLKELTVKYNQSGDTYFPLHFIIVLLEQRSFELELDQSHLFMCLLEAGLSPIRLLNEYHRVYLSKDAFWLDNQAQLYIPQIVLKLSSYIMTSHNILNVTEKRHVVEWLSGHIPIYLTDLEGMSITPTLREMITQFRELLSSKY
ncbi:Nuclear pore complex protein [Oopsacas minuta]|uniref:Nuclear pore complex protein n=1 Tax=Oopsacas minuta TaxID=111878 RepID=A0AAV7JD01_9METZ|nr:Nuclear pore complex protein [Oopsacas minuta]